MMRDRFDMLPARFPNPLHGSTFKLLVSFPFSFLVYSERWSAYVIGYGTHGKGSQDSLRRKKTSRVKSCMTNSNSFWIARCYAFTLTFELDLKVP